MQAKPLFAYCAGLLFVASALAAGQAKEKVLYSFGTNPSDGGAPNTGVLFDKAGNLYGTAPQGGTGNAGIVFELTPSGQGSWTETIIYNFCTQANCIDGRIPEAGLISDNAGNLYGTTTSGGTSSNDTCSPDGCGTVFELIPPPVPGSSWAEKVLWNFEGSGAGDGAGPYGRLRWDAAGNLYGVTFGGGSGSLGTVFELSPDRNGDWNESLLYEFCPNGPPCPDGAYPDAGVSFDKSGNLYGTTSTGAFGSKWGTVYRLSPQDGGGWTETTLHRFTSHGGGKPSSEVSVDAAGSLYGTVFTGGDGCGGVWRLTPQPGGVFTIRTILFEGSGADGCGPGNGVLLDAKRKTVFGTTVAGGDGGNGTVFKITGERLTVLYSFCQRPPSCSDGVEPIGLLTARGMALYGTTDAGGEFSHGVVFEITP